MDTQTQVAPSTSPQATPRTAAAEPVVTLTERAVKQVHEVIQQQGFEGYYFTVRVVPSGCSGFGYDLNLLKDTKSGDVVWEQDGVKLATDGLSASYLKGTVVDYVVGDHSSGFKFENPQAKSSCGCGSSFST